MKSMFVVLLICLLSLISCENSIDTTELSSKEKNIMQELVRYDIADSLLKNPAELKISFSTVQFENLNEDVEIAEYLVSGEYQHQPFVWRVWKNTNDYGWAYNSQECISGCPDSQVFSSKIEMQTFMELHWLKMEHNRMVEECRCANIEIKPPNLPIIEVSDETREYIAGVRENADLLNVEEKRKSVNDSVQLIEKTADILKRELYEEDAYAFFLKELSRYLNLHMMRYNEVTKTYGISSNEMIALNNETEVYDHDEGASYVGILSNIDYYNHPNIFDKEQSAFKELLVHVYRLYQFSWLHALYHESSNEFLRDIDAEKKAIISIYNKNELIFQKYNLNEMVYNLENTSVAIDEKVEENYIEESKEQGKIAEETKANSSETCEKDEPLFTRTLDSHNITLHGDDVIFSNLEVSYAGGSVGDSIVEGSFYLCVDSTNKELLSMKSINLQREHMIYTVSGNSDLLVLEEHETSNGNIAFLFSLNGNKLYPINIDHKGEGLFTGTKIKAAGPGIYQYMYYNNSTFTYFLYEFELRPGEMLAETISYSEMADQTIFEQFVQNPSYIYVH